MVHPDKYDKVIHSSPFLRSIMTDLTSPLLIQQNGKCEFFEMRYMECLEAYGADRGLLECELQRADYDECITARFQKLRVQALKDERKKQAKAAGLSKKEIPYLAPPAKDAFMFTDAN